MQLVNLYSRPVYWRTFNEDDTDHAIGLHDGILQVQQSVRLKEQTRTGRFQLELKHEHIFGKFIAQAGSGSLYGEDGSVMTVQASGTAVHFYRPVVTGSSQPSPACQALYDQLAQLQADLQTSTNKTDIIRRINDINAQLDSNGC